MFMSVFNGRKVEFKCNVGIILIVILLKKDPTNSFYKV